MVATGRQGRVQTQTAWVRIPVSLLCHHESVTWSSKQLLISPHITGVHSVCPSEHCRGSDFRPQGSYHGAHPQ